MKLNHGIHLAYCTNVHRGETWAETCATLERHTLPVRRRVAAGQPYAIGLRLGQRAAAELAEPATSAAFRHWLDANDCYVFVGDPRGRGVLKRPGHNLTPKAVQIQSEVGSSSPRRRAAPGGNRVQR